MFQDIPEDMTTALKKLFSYLNKIDIEIYIFDTIPNFHFLLSASIILINMQNWQYFIKRDDGLKRKGVIHVIIELYSEYLYEIWPYITLFLFLCTVIFKPLQFLIDFTYYFTSYKHYLLHLFNFIFLIPCLHCQ